MVQPPNYFSQLAEVESAVPSLANQVTELLRRLDDLGVSAQQKLRIIQNCFIMAHIMCAFSRISKTTEDRVV